MALYDSLYPYFGVATLREQHGQQWADIVDQVRSLNVTDPHVMAFTMTVKKIRKQSRLSASLCKDPLCSVCTAEIMAHFKGTEEDLIRFYYNNLRDIQQTMKLMHTHRIDRYGMAQASAVA